MGKVTRRSPALYPPIPCLIFCHMMPSAIDSLPYRYFIDCKIFFSIKILSSSLSRGFSHEQFYLKLVYACNHDFLISNKFLKKRLKTLFNSSSSSSSTTNKGQYLNSLCFLIFIDFFCLWLLLKKINLIGRFVKKKNFFKLFAQIISCDINWCRE